MVTAQRTAGQLTLGVAILALTCLTVVSLAWLGTRSEKRQKNATRRL
ncbi:UNVERIFIED_CONTAM: hypothetical protein OHV15_01990 [Microbacterium sp. SLM126]